MPAAGTGATLLLEEDDAVVEERDEEVVVEVIKGLVREMRGLELL